MQREHLLTAVLADDTRFSIYRHVAERPSQAVSVVDVAGHFGVHPNVARMHLSKLEQAGLLTTTLRKREGGGRPAKLYRLADSVSTFAFPPRRYELLAALALDIVAESSDEEIVRDVCHRVGWQMAREYRLERGIDGVLAGNSLAAAVQDIAEEQGLLPDVEWRGKSLDIEIRNCVFREAALLHPELSCVIHRSFLRGLIDGLSGEGGSGEISADDSSLGCGGERCHMRYASRSPSAS